MAYVNFSISPTQAKSGFLQIFGPRESGRLASSVAPGLNNGPLLSPAEAGRQISLGHFRRPTAPGLPRSGGRQFAAGGCESSPDHPMSLASDHIVESFKPMWSGQEAAWLTEKSFSRQNASAHRLPLRIRARLWIQWPRLIFERNCFKGTSSGSRGPAFLMNSTSKRFPYLGSKDPKRTVAYLSWKIGRSQTPGPGYWCQWRDDFAASLETPTSLNFNLSSSDFMMVASSRDVSSKAWHGTQSLKFRCCQTLWANRQQKDPSVVKGNWWKRVGSSRKSLYNSQV